MLEIDTTPNNNLLKDYENNKSSFGALLSEYIDNSCSAMVNNECNVLITVAGPWDQTSDKYLNRQKSTLTIIDDASGISKENLAEAFKLAGQTKNKGVINEHGMGFKIASISLGTKFDDKLQKFVGFELTTLPKDSNVMYRVSELNIGKVCVEALPPDKLLFPKGHGSQIKISYLKDKVFKNKQHYTKIVNYLSHRYQFYIRGIYGGKLKLQLKLLDDKQNIVIDNNSQEYIYNIQDMIPALFEDKWSKEERLSSGKGDVWNAIVRFGIAPSTEDIKNYTDSRKDQSKSDHPYHIHGKKIDLIYKGIVLQQVEFDWLSTKTKITKETLFRYYQKNSPRMQIFLEKGFNTTTNKDSVVDNDNLEDLKDKIHEVFGEYLHGKKKQDETQIKDKIEKILKTSCNNVKRETTTSIYGLVADFSLERRGKSEIWEIKKEEGTGPDVIQLIGYLITSTIKNGVLVADGFNDNAKNLAQDACKILPGCSIELIELNTYL